MGDLCVSLNAVKPGFLPAAEALNRNGDDKLCHSEVAEMDAEKFEEFVNAIRTDPIINVSPLIEDKEGGEWIEIAKSQLDCLRNLAKDNGVSLGKIMYLIDYSLGSTMFTGESWKGSPWIFQWGFGKSGDEVWESKRLKVKVEKPFVLPTGITGIERQQQIGIIGPQQIETKARVKIENGQVIELDLSDISQISKIKTLEGLASLKKLNLNGTQVSDDQIQVLKTLLPNLEIIEKEQNKDKQFQFPKFEQSEELPEDFSGKKAFDKEFMSPSPEYKPYEGRSEKPDTEIDIGVAFGGGYFNIKPLDSKNWHPTVNPNFGINFNLSERIKAVYNIGYAFTEISYFDNHSLHSISQKLGLSYDVLHHWPEGTRKDGLELNLGGGLLLKNNFLRGNKPTFNTFNIGGFTSAELGFVASWGGINSYTFETTPTTEGWTKMSLEVGASWGQLVNEIVILGGVKFCFEIY